MTLLTAVPGRACPRLAAHELTRRPRRDSWTSVNRFAFLRLYFGRPEQTKQVCQAMCFEVADVAHPDALLLIQSCARVELAILVPASKDDLESHRHGHVASLGKSRATWAICIPGWTS